MLMIVRQLTPTVLRNALVACGPEVLLQRDKDGRTAEAVGRAHGMFAREGRAMRRLSLGSARVAGDAAACARVARASRVVGSGFRGRRRSGTETPRV